MNRLGVFDNIKIGGSVYLYSGKASGGVISSLMGKSDRGLLPESFVLDISPSGLVRAYEQQGKWKRRFLQFELCTEGVLLYIFRPPKLSIRERLVMKTSSQSSESSPGGSPAPQSTAANEKFAQLIASGKAGCKSRILLSGSPVSVRKLRLMEGSATVGSFSLRKCDSFADSEVKVRVVTVAQVLLEGNCFIEFFGRDEEHVEKWISRLNIVAGIHRAFHALQRTVSNPSSYPASAKSRDEFVVSVPGTQYARIPGELHVQHTSNGYSVCIVSEPSPGAELIFWRACFDESPILEPQSISFPVVQLTALEQDRINLGDDAFLADRESCWLTLESISHAALSKLFYYTKWASFFATFVKHFEELNDQHRGSGGRGDDSSRTQRLRDVSSFVASPNVLEAARSGSRGGFAASDDDDGSDNESSLLLQPQSSKPAALSPVSSVAAPSPASSSPRSLIQGPPVATQILVAMDEQRQFQASLSSPAKQPAGDTSPLRRSGDPSKVFSGSSSPSTSSPGGTAGGGAPSAAPRTAPVTQVALERRAADERLCRQVPLMLVKGDIASVMTSMMDFYEQYGTGE